MPAVVAEAGAGEEEDTEALIVDVEGIILIDVVFYLDCYLNAC